MNWPGIAQHVQEQWQDFAGARESPTLAGFAMHQARRYDPDQSLATIAWCVDTFPGIWAELDACLPDLMSELVQVLSRIPALVSAPARAEDTARVYRFPRHVPFALILLAITCAATPFERSVQARAPDNTPQAAAWQRAVQLLLPTLLPALQGGEARPFAGVWNAAYLFAGQPTAKEEQGLPAWKRAAGQHASAGETSTMQTLKAGAAEAAPCSAASPGDGPILHLGAKLMALVNFLALSVRLRRSADAQVQAFLASDVTVAISRVDELPAEDRAPAQCLALYSAPGQAGEMQLRRAEFGPASAAMLATATLLETTAKCTGANAAVMADEGAVQVPGKGQALLARNAMAGAQCLRGMLRHGALAEEVASCSFPEAIALLLVCARLRDNEAVAVHGLAGWGASALQGYGKQLRFVPDSAVEAAVAAAPATLLRPSPVLYYADALNCSSLWSDDLATTQHILQELRDAAHALRGTRYTNVVPPANTAPSTLHAPWGYQFTQPGLHREVLKLCAAVSAVRAAVGDAPFVFQSGSWGCGAFGGHRALKYYLHALVSAALQVPMVITCTTRAKPAQAAHAAWLATAPTPGCSSRLQFLASQFSGAASRTCAADCALTARFGQAAQLKYSLLRAGHGLAVQLAAQGWVLEQVAPGVSAVPLSPASADTLQAQIIGSVLRAVPLALHEALAPAWQESSADAAVAQHCAGAHMTATFEAAADTTAARAIALALLVSQ